MAIGSMAIGSMAIGSMAIGLMAIGSMAIYGQRQRSFQRSRVLEHPLYFFIII
jgi:hypothetical protein